VCQCFSTVHFNTVLFSLNVAAFLDTLFVNSLNELLFLSIIVCIGGIVRGCIGFGFSALVIASTSFWIDVKYTVVMVIFMEVLASLFMLKEVKNEIDYSLLKILTIVSAIFTCIGVWVLANINSDWHQILMSIYLLLIASMSLFKFTFKHALTNARLAFTATVAGFYGGLAGIGGIFIAAMLTSSEYPVKKIRATMVVYFFMIEAVFFVAAYINNLVTLSVIFTSIVLSFPMMIGLVYGSRLFKRLSEKTLKDMVLIALLILSIAGLVKTFV